MNEEKLKELIKEAKLKMNEEIIISCDGKERKGMSTMAMDMNKYIEGVK